MNNKKRFCVTFAGPVGSSKSPIAHFLSYKLNLPIFSTDSIRTEVVEDFLKQDFEEYKRRRILREDALLKSGISHIYDASVDREWENHCKKLIEHNYSYFIISLDVSRQLLTKLYEIKSYDNSLKYIDKYLEDHENFLSKFGKEVGLHIHDTDFPTRLDKSLNAVTSWLLTF